MSITFSGLKVDNSIRTSNVFFQDGSRMDSGPYIFSSYLVDSTQVNDSTTFTERAVMNTSPIVNTSGFTVNSSNVTVPVDGIYRMYVSAFYAVPTPSASPDRQSVEVTFGVNESALPFVGSQGYLRDPGTGDTLGAGNYVSTASLEIFQNLSEGDRISLFFRRSANNGTVRLDGINSTIYIIKV